MSDELNEFDVLIQNQDKFKEDALRASMMGAVQKNRAEQPKLFELSNKTQLPVSVIETDIQGVQQTVDYEANEFDTLIKDYPAISEYLTDPNRAALVYDDVGALVHATDYVRSGGAGVVSVGSGLKGLADIGDAIRNKVLGDPLSEFDLNDPVQKAQHDVYSKLFGAVDPHNGMRVVGEGFKSLAEYIRPPEERMSFGTDVAEGLGQLGGQVVLAMFTGGTTSTVLFGGMGADQMEEEASREGASQEDKDNAVLMGAMITAASEKLGIDLLLNRLPPAIKNKVVRSIVDIMIGGGIEATEEAAENIMFNFAEQITFDPDQELFDGVGYDASVGGTVGAIARGIVLGTNKRIRTVEQQRAEAEQAENNKQNIKGLLERVEQTGVVENAPQEAEVLFQSMMEKEGVESFTVDAKELLVNIEEAGGNTDEVLGRLGIREEIIDAADNGDQVSIPAGKFISEFSNSDLQEAALNAYRADESSMTFHQSQTVLNRLEAETKQAIEDANIEADKVFEMEERADQVRDAVAASILQGDVETALGQRHRIAELFRSQAMRQMVAWEVEGKEFDPVAFYEGFGLTFKNNKGEPAQAGRRNVDVDLSAMLNDIRSDREGTRANLEREAYGPSISDIAREVGIRDDQGDLLSQDIDKDKKPDEAMLRTDGKSIDELGEYLFELGYFNERPSVDDVIQAIVNDEAANPADKKFVEENVNRDVLDRLEQMNQLEAELERQGIDINSLDNDQIIEKLFGDEDVLYQGENTKTEAFKAWFGDSKVVDENGEPLVVYHGTRESFEKFDKNKIGERHPTYSFGFHFSSNPDEASIYSKEDGSIMPVFLSIQNPLIIKTGLIASNYADNNKSELIRDILNSRKNKKVIDDASLLKALAGEDVELIEREIQATPYDGIIINGRTDTNYITFNPEQIKSIHNNGNFNPNDDRILYQGNIKKLNEEAVSKILDPDNVDIGLKVGKKARFWRGINSSAGYNGASYGQGLYVAGSRSEANEYAGDNGRVIEMDITDLPNNPLRFATIMEYQNWLNRAQKELGYKGPREFNSEWLDIGDFVISLDPELDGIQIGTGKDAIFVNYNGRTLFQSLRDPVAVEFSRKIDDFLDGGEIDNVSVLSKETPLLEKLGIPSREMVVTKSVLKKVLTEKHGDNVDPEVIKRLPELLSDPLAIIVSGKSLVHVLDAKDKNGKQVVAAIKPSGMIKRDKAHIVLSTYGKNEFTNWFGKQKGNLVYVDDTKNRPIRELASAPIAESDDQATKYNIRKKSELVKEMNQENRGGITAKTGSFGQVEATYEIFTNPNADMSTLLHETGHLFLEMMRREAAMEDAPQSVIDNMNATLDYLGVESADQIGTEQHELWARTFEVYLRTGKAPSVKLRRAFSKFKAWLVNIYRTLTGEYDIEINNEVRSIFDNMLATEEEILQAEADLGVDFNTEIAELLDASDLAEYRRKEADAHEEAMNKALAAKMREAEREQTKTWKENRKGVEAKVKEQVWNEPIYQVWHLIHRGEFFNQNTPDHLKGKKLDKQSLIDIYGTTGILKDLKSKYQVEDGIDVEYLASRMGFENSVEFVKALIEAEKPDARIQRITDEQMAEAYPKEDVSEIALRAVQNDRQSIFLETVLKTLRQKSTKKDKARYSLDVVREAVAQKVETMKIKDVMGKARTYLANSRRAGTELKRALVDKDYDVALEAARKQLFHYEMFRKISDTKKETDRMKARLYKLGNKKIDPKRMKPAYIERIKDLLQAYSFTNNNKPREARRAIDALEKFVLEQNRDAIEEGRVEIQISPKLMEASEITDWRDLTFEQLSDIDSAARTLAHIGRTESREEQEAFNKKVEDIAVSIEDNVRVRKTWGTVADQETTKTSFWNNLAPAYLRRLPSLINEFDGFGFDGPMAKAILTPLEEATVKLEEMLYPIRERISENQKKHYNIKELMTLKKRNIYVEQTNSLFTKENILALAHNWGNQGNRDAILNGEKTFKGLSEADIQNILDEHMTKKDWDFVQESLDIINSLWPEISDLQRRQTGIAPEKVDSMPIQTKFGEYRGGYYPLKYSALDSRQANHKAKEAATNTPVLGIAASTTKHGHTIERSGAGGADVELSLDVMYNHIGSAIHDLAYREAIQEAARVMRSKPVADAIIKTKGPQAYKVMQLILSAQAVGDAVPVHGFEAASKHMRLNFAIAVIGLNMRSILTQPTGMFQAFVSNKVGFGYMAKALGEFVMGGIHMRRNIQNIHDKSPYMKRRSTVFRNELREQNNKIGASGARDSVVAASFYPMIKLDAMISGIVWNGAYNKAQDQGLDEQQSIRFADRMVRDTQSSGEQYQLSGLTNSGEFGKALTIFGSYFSATYNLTVESFNQAKIKGDPKAWGAFTMDMILLHGAQGFLAALMLEHWPEDEDEWGMWTLRAMLAQVTGMVPVVSAAYRSVMSGFGVNSLPSDAVINTTLRAGQSLASDIEEGELTEGTVKDLARSASYVAGIPAVNGVIRGYEILEEDDDAGLLDVLLRPKKK